MSSGSAKSFPFRLEFPPELPISARAEEITAAIQASQVVILAGETGSGKTTQIPKMCLAAGRGTKGRIACTQPRRVAALSISRRVAEELGVDIGREVGCKVRFSDQTSRATVIKFLTDGMLLAELQGDPMLREYDTIIIDEAHERSLNIDFLLGHLRNLRFTRPDLKIIITSATIDTEAFSAAFDGAPVVVVEGRTYPVEVIYAPLDELGSDYTDNDENADTTDRSAVTAAKAEALHYIDGTVEAIERVVRESGRGDVLAFLPSERDIREARDLLDGRRLRDCEIVPLFGRLSNAEQQRVFAPTQRRKIVLATNIAETSLTIPGIRFVIDSGLARISRYSPSSRTRRLPIEEIAQSSAEQRKGRAGRVAEGICIRLYSEKDFLERPRFTQPEIQRANLADVILRMKAFGLGDIERFPFINMPATKAVRSGYALLEELGALGEAKVERSTSGAGRGHPNPLARGIADKSAPTRTAASGDSAPHKTEEAGAGDRCGRGALTPRFEAAGAEEPALPQSSGVGAPRPQEPAALNVLELTPIGRELARLPVDPTVGRMILQAREEKALREVIAIAAGLSIQDPRERPLDKQQQADAAHRRFVHPDSDFLTLLNIWDAYHGEFETLSQAKLRRFCRDHFLSYTRMREWRDIHTQLLEVLEERDGFRMSSALDKVADSSRGPGLGRGTGSARGTGVSPVKPGHQENRRGSEKTKPHGSSKAAAAEPTRGAHRRQPEPTDPLAFGTPAYRAIHRSVLAGLLGNIAQLDEENGGYKATHDRRVTLFPGSVLFRREEPKKRRPGSDQPAPKKEVKTPRWIMAAEIVETSRLFARTCARLDPLWALDLGSHLVRVAHSEPFWNESAGRVMVRQRTRLYGLELESRAVGYGKIDPRHATEIFIREGLVNDTIQFPLPFIAHNRAVREELEDLLTRARDSGYLNLDEAAYRFYADRLMPDTPSAGLTFKVQGLRPEPSSAELQPAPEDQRGEGTPPTAPSGLKFKVQGVRAEPSGAELRPETLNLRPRGNAAISSVAELVDLVRHREPRFLCMEPEDLRDPETITHDADAFPKSVPLENHALPLNYAYKPGEPDDGVTVTVNVREAEELTPAALDWAVPGHLEAKVEHYLRALPKELRRGFVPLGETAKALAGDLGRDAAGSKGEGSESKVGSGDAIRRAQPKLKPETSNVERGEAVVPSPHMPLPEALAALIAEKYHIAIDPAVWADKPPPEHLRVRIRVVDSDGRELCASRELDEIRSALLAQSRKASIAVAREEPAAWRAARAQWETPEFGSWAFDELPERVLVAEQGGAPAYAFPGLFAGKDGVARRLFKTPEEADAATRHAVSTLLEKHLGHDLMWTQRDLRALKELGPLVSTLVPVDKLQEQAFEAIRRWVTDPGRVGTGGARSGLSADSFTNALERARADLRGLVPKLGDLLKEILGLRQDLLVVRDPPASLAGDLGALMPPDFVAITPYERLRHFPRYLKAMKVRAERWRKNPGKDAERAAELAPYEKALQELWKRRSTRGPSFDEAVEALRWLVEEYRVSLFAQELGTAEPVSDVKLDRALAALRGGGPSAATTQAAPAPNAKPIVSAPVGDKQKKSTPLKNLGALDKLFR